MSLSVFRLESRADSLTRGNRVRRTYVDMLRCAVAFAVVISAVLDRAVDALDVLVATSLVSAIVHFSNRPFGI